MIWLHLGLSLCAGLMVGAWAYRVERSVLIAIACGLTAMTFYGPCAAIISKWLHGQFGSVQF